MLDTKGLAFRTWRSLTLSTCAFLTLMALFVVVFLEPFCQHIELWDLERLAARMEADYDRTDRFAMLDQLARDNGLRVIVLTEELDVVLLRDGFTPHPASSGADALTEAQLQTLAELRQDLSRHGGGHVHRFVNGSNESINVVIYFTQLSDPDFGSVYVYLSSAVTPLTETIPALEIEFVIVAALMMVLTVFVGLGLSRRLASPLIALTGSAQRLGRGDLTVEFDGGGVTETEQLAQTLNYATGELRDIQRDRQELLANVSHDLKTPLTIIKIYSETIRDVSGDNPPLRQTHCETIIEEANRLTDLVNEILEISRLESGSASIELSQINLTDCLEETLSRFAILAESKGYVFHCDIDPDVPILGDAHYMQRVFYNLIGNAVHYTGADKVVRISLRRNEQRVRFEVTDTGPGIPPDKVATIWDRYYKSRTNHRRPVVGSGIGLSIVKHLLVAHQARFGVTSGSAAGSTFWFECDLAPQAGAKAPASLGPALAADRSEPDQPQP
ncbi:MAG: HAMP domain-containing histidine kinase [Propionibacteriaceae bacterium]|jgi:signal transduction histidine kinase|nr:HAMP domain-containing histidine kinase [Propionibacteriaceae bacterium]